MSGRPVARIGDTTDHGGTIITGDETFSVEGSSVARVGDIHDCPRHGKNPIVTGVPSTFDRNKTVAVVGSKTACGAVITTGAATFMIGVPAGFDDIPVAADIPVAQQNVADSAEARKNPIAHWCAKKREIENSKEIQDAMRKAWLASTNMFVDPPQEHGGWIVRGKDGNLHAVPVPPGEQGTLKMGKAPEGAEGWYHTHPNKTGRDKKGDLYRPEPSDDDLDISKNADAIGVVMTHERLYWFTPTQKEIWCP